jgi:hypothetical protein
MEVVQVDNDVESGDFIKRQGDIMPPAIDMGAVSGGIKVESPLEQYRALSQSDPDGILAALDALAISEAETDEQADMVILKYMEMKQ